MRLPRLCLGAGLLLACGCAAVTDPAIAVRVEAVSGARLHGDVVALCEIGPRPGYDRGAMQRSIAHIERELRAAGLEPQREEFVAATTVRADSEIRVEDREHVNVIAEVRGRSHPERVLEIGAHYDTVPGSPGADDNASAVAGLLEIARGLAGVRIDRTIRLLFLAQEEDGLCGSRHHVSRIRAGEQGRVAGFVSLEMIGYTSREEGSQRTPLRIPFLFEPPTIGDFVAVIGNLGSGWIGNVFEGAADRYVPDLRYYSLNRLGGFFGDAARSDHQAYWEAGLHGLMLSDTANFRNPHYHRPSDTPETLDHEFHLRVTQAALAMALEWAGTGLAGDSGLSGDSGTAGDTHTGGRP